MASSPPCLADFGSFFDCSPFVRFQTLPRICPRLLQPIRNRIRHPTRRHGLFRSFPAPFHGLLRLLSRILSPSSSALEVTQPKRTRELPQHVKSKGLGEDVGVLSIRQNILKFDFTREDTLTDKVIVHLNVLSPGVEDGVLR